MTENWYDAFPAPRRTAPLIPRDVVLASLSSPELLLIDVRRTDFEGGTIKGSLNLPAHSFYMNRAVLYDLCKRAGVKQVAFYCGRLLKFDYYPTNPLRKDRRRCNQVPRFLVCAYS